MPTLNLRLDGSTGAEERSVVVVQDALYEDTDGVYLNVFVPRTSRCASAYLDATSAVALRDGLLERYPLPTPAEILAARTAKREAEYAAKVAALFADFPIGTPVTVAGKGSGTVTTHQEPYVGVTLDSGLRGGAPDGGWLSARVELDVIPDPAWIPGFIPGQKVVVPKGLFSIPSGSVGVIEDVVVGEDFYEVSVEGATPSTPGYRTFPLFESEIEPAPEARPLQVGDRVRIVSGGYGYGSDRFLAVGDLGTITKVYSEDCFAVAPLDPAKKHDDGGGYGWTFIDSQVEHAPAPACEFGVRDCGCLAD